MISEELLQEFRAFPSTHVLITGANGMLGRAFTDALRDLLPQCDVRSADHAALDITDAAQLLKQAEWLNGGWVLHCACVVSVERCEKDKDLARDVILHGTEHVCALARAAGAKVFYPQSFLIFDGLVNPIHETTEPRPHTHYGNLKLAAEMTVLDQVPGSLVARMGGFFGGAEVDKNFVGKIFRQCVDQMRRGEKSLRVGDRVWQPTYTRDIAENALALIVRGRAGIYQMACHGEASFFEVAGVLVDQLDLESSIELEKVTSVEVSRGELGPRPDRAILENRRLMAEGLDCQRPWREALAEYLAEPFFSRRPVGAP